MSQYDLRSALYAPLRVLVYERSDGRTVVEYDQPSTLPVSLATPRLRQPVYCWTRNWRPSFDTRPNWRASSDVGSLRASYNYLSLFSRGSKVCNLALHTTTAIGACYEISAHTRCAVSDPGYCPHSWTGGGRALANKQLPINHTAFDSGVFRTPACSAGVGGVPGQQGSAGWLTCD
jgi:hypothetical protein